MPDFALNRSFWPRQWPAGLEKPEESNIKSVNAVLGALLGMRCFTVLTLMLGLALPAPGQAGDIFATKQRAKLFK